MIHFTDLGRLLGPTEGRIFHFQILFGVFFAVLRFLGLVVALGVRLDWWRWDVTGARGGRSATGVAGHCDEGVRGMRVLLRTCIMVERC